MRERTSGGRQESLIFSSLSFFSVRCPLFGYDARRKEVQRCLGNSFRPKRDLIKTIEASYGRKKRIERRIRGALFSLFGLPIRYSFTRRAANGRLRDGCRAPVQPALGQLRWRAREGPRGSEAAWQEREPEPCEAVLLPRCSVAVQWR